MSRDYSDGSWSDDFDQSTVDPVEQPEAPIQEHELPHELLVESQHAGYDEPPAPDHATPVLQHIVEGQHTLDPVVTAHGGNGGGLADPVQADFAPTADGHYWYQGQQMTFERMATAAGWPVNGHAATSHQNSFTGSWTGEPANDNSVGADTAAETNSLLTRYPVPEQSVQVEVDSLVTRHPEPASEIVQHPTQSNVHYYDDGSAITTSADGQTSATGSAPGMQPGEMPAVLGIIDFRVPASAAGIDQTREFIRTATPGMNTLDMFTHLINEADIHPIIYTGADGNTAYVDSKQERAINYNASATTIQDLAASTSHEVVHLNMNENLKNDPSYVDPFGIRVFKDEPNIGSPLTSAYERYFRFDEGPATGISAGSDLADAQLALQNFDGSDQVIRAINQNLSDAQSNLQRQSEFIDRSQQITTAVVGALDNGQSVNISMNSGLENLNRDKSYTIDVRLPDVGYTTVQFILPDTLKASEVNDAVRSQISQTNQALNQQSLILAQQVEIYRATRDIYFEKKNAVDSSRGG